MRDLCGKGRLGKSEIDHCGEPIVQLISGFTKLEVFEKHAGPHTESAPYSPRGHKSIWETSFSRGLVALSVKCLKTHAGRSKMAPYAHLWETTLWGNRLSTTVWGL